MILTIGRGFILRGFEPRLIKLEFIIYLPKLKVLVINSKIPIL